MADITANPPYRYEPLHQCVYGVCHKNGHEVMVCDVRGWGYLTGKGQAALGLETDAAKRIQDQTGETIARLLNAEFSATS